MSDDYMRVVLERQMLRALGLLPRNWPTVIPQTYACPIPRELCARHRWDPYTFRCDWCGCSQKWTMSPMMVRR